MSQRDMPAASSSRVALARGLTRALPSLERTPLLPISIASCAPRWSGDPPLPEGAADPLHLRDHNQEEALTMSDRIAVMHNGALRSRSALRPRSMPIRATAFVAGLRRPCQPFSRARLLGVLRQAWRAWTGRARACWCRSRATAAPAGRCGTPSSSEDLEGRARRQRLPTRPTVTGCRARCATSIFKGQTANYIVALTDGSDHRQRRARRPRSAAERGRVVVHWPGRPRGVLPEFSPMPERAPPRRTCATAAIPLRLVCLAGPRAVFIVVAPAAARCSDRRLQLLADGALRAYADWNLNNYRSLLGRGRLQDISSCARWLTAALVSLVCPRRSAGRCALFHRQAWRPLPPCSWCCCWRRRSSAGVILRVTALQGLFGPIGLR